MKKMLFDVIEAILFIVIISFIIKILDNFNIDINGIFVVAVFLIVWLIAKMTLIKYFKNRGNR